MYAVEPSIVAVMLNTLAHAEVAGIPAARRARARFGGENRELYHRSGGPGGGAARPGNSVAYRGALRLVRVRRCGANAIWRGNLRRGDQQSQPGALRGAGGHVARNWEERSETRRRVIRRSTRCFDADRPRLSLAVPRRRTRKRVSNADVVGDVDRLRRWNALRVCRIAPRIAYTVRSHSSTGATAPRRRRGGSCCSSTEASGISLF